MGKSKIDRLLEKLMKENKPVPLDDAAKLLGCSVSGLRKLLARNPCPISYEQERKGCAIFIPLSEIVRYRKERTVLAENPTEFDFWFSKSVANQLKDMGVERDIRRVNGQVYLEAVRKGKRPKMRAKDRRLVYSGAGYRITVNGVVVDRAVIGEF